MGEHQFHERTRRLALRAIRLSGALPPTPAAEVIGQHLLRAITSAGVNSRAACRGCSHDAAIARLDVVLADIDEAIYWLELLGDSGIVQPARVNDLIAESTAIAALTAASLQELRDPAQPRH